MQEKRVQSPGREDPLEEEMTTHSSILAWEIPWTEETGGQQSVCSQRDRRKWMAEQKKEWKGNEDSKKRPPLRNSAFCNKAENDTGARGFSFFNVCLHINGDNSVYIESLVIQRSGKLAGTTSWGSGHGTGSDANTVSLYQGTSGKARMLPNVGRAGGDLQWKASAGGCYSLRKQEAKSSPGSNPEGSFSQGIVGILVLNSQLA